MHQLIGSHIHTITLHSHSSGKRKFCNFYRNRNFLSAYAKENSFVHTKISMQFVAKFTGNLFTTEQCIQSAYGSTFAIEHKNFMRNNIYKLKKFVRAYILYGLNCIGGMLC